MLFISAGSDLLVTGCSSLIVNSWSNASSKMFCLKMFNYLLW